MNLADRVVRRFLARSTPRLDFFPGERDTAIETLKTLTAYGKGLLKARDLLRPVAECLSSKPLSKIYVRLTGAIDMLPVLGREVEGIIADLQTIDHALVVEGRRHTEIARDAPDDYEVDVREVRVPTPLLKALEARLKRYHETVEKTFDQSFSIDEIGNAGSADLKAYERLMEKLPSWEELNLFEFEGKDLDEAVASYAMEALY